MNTIVIVIGFVVFIWVGFVASFQGLDLRKRSDWLYVIAGFLGGLVIGIALSGDFLGSLNIGIIFAFMTLFTGAVMRRHKQKYGSATARSLIQKYEKEDPSSLFVKFARKLFSRYK